MRLLLLALALGIFPNVQSVADKQAELSAANLEGISGQLPTCPVAYGKRVLADTKLIIQTEGLFCGASYNSTTPPLLAPFGDADYYLLASPLRYNLGSAQDVVVIPSGFVTDRASIPRPLWIFLPRDGQYMTPAILHDYLYWDQRCTKDEADWIFKREMEKFGVPEPIVQEIYEGVHRLGLSAWSENSRTRLASYRVVPEGYLRQFLNSPLDATRTWRALQERMRKDGVKVQIDTGNPDVADICKRVSRR